MQNQLPPITQQISGHKRNYTDNTSDTTSTTTSYNLSPDTTINNNNIHTTFASHLPPLHKRSKLNNMQSFPTKPMQISSPVPDNILPDATLTCDKLFMNNNLNNNTNNNTIFNLDNLISAIGNLPSINTYQMNVLSQLILATDNNNNNNNNNNMKVVTQQPQIPLVLPIFNSQRAPQLQQRQHRQLNNRIQTQTVNILQNCNKNIKMQNGNKPNNNINKLKNAQKTKKKNKHKNRNKNKIKQKYEYKYAANTNNNMNISSEININQNEQGQSCHQCKTKKDVKILFYCTKKRQGLNGNNNNKKYNSKKKKCRKKYCKSCMSKYYDDNDIINLNKIKDCENVWKWECPSCKGVCSCRACKRKRQQSR